jgi:predicted DCC family thiol-disulfide oxidoreductase YuxK
VAAESSSPSIILFDGVCNLCNGFVQFVIRRDERKCFIFGALQSEKAKEILSHFNLPKENFKTIILIEDDKVFTQSTAVLKIAKQLNGWKLFYAFIIIPKFIRDFVYSIVSKYRYKIFGKRDACMIPTPELKGRFLD